MATKFHRGDMVFSPHFGKGIVTMIYQRDNSQFPICVEWIEENKPHYRGQDCFTLNGQYQTQFPEPDFDIIPIEETGGYEMEQIAGVINHNVEKKENEDNEKMHTEDEKFHVGDRVYTKFNGYGTITGTHGADRDYPILVEWDSDTNTLSEAVSIYTADGEYYARMHDPESSLTKVKKDERTIERMEDALNKKVEDAVNPAHYKVEGLPEAIDIINHLMHREQYEGFLWGNILKYAYRFGRKGDKAATAGKIEWYAKQLKDLEEESRK